MMMIPTKRIMSNIEMFLPHSISNRSTQVLEGGMDTHLRKDWIFVFLWLDFFFYLPAIVSVFWSGWYSLKQYSVWIELKVLYWVITIQIASLKSRHRNFFKLYAMWESSTIQFPFNNNLKKSPSFAIFWLSFNCWFVGWLPSKIAFPKSEIED